MILPGDVIALTKPPPLHDGSWWTGMDSLGVMVVMYVPGQLHPSIEIRMARRHRYKRIPLDTTAIIAAVTQERAYAIIGGSTLVIGGGPFSQMLDRGWTVQRPADRGKLGP